MRHRNHWDKGVSEGTRVACLYRFPLIENRTDLFVSTVLSGSPARASPLRLRDRHVRTFSTVGPICLRNKRCRTEEDQEDVVIQFSEASIKEEIYRIRQRAKQNTGGASICLHDFCSL